MKNKAKINYDGINLYITLNVKNKKIANIFLLTGVLLLIITIIFIFSQILVGEHSDGMIPGIILFSLFLFFPIKYLLWNLFGSEHLIINTKSISYSYHYGFMETKLKTEPFSILHMEKVSTGDFQGIERGQLHFYRFREKDNLREFMHQTTVQVDYQEIERMKTEIINLFNNEFIDNFGFVGYSLN